MKLIPLVNSDKWAIVDDQDYDEVSVYAWKLFKIKDRVYARAWIKEVGDVTMHRFIMQPEKWEDVDHKDILNSDNGIDNRRFNLRVCSHALNQANTRKHVDGKSKYKGLYWHKKNEKWVARCMVDGNQYNLGSYTSEIDAAKAYNKFAIEKFREFARVNDV